MISMLCWSHCSRIASAADVFEQRIRSATCGPMPGTARSSLAVAVNTLAGAPNTDFRLQYVLGPRPSIRYNLNKDIKLLFSVMDFWHAVMGNYALWPFNGSVRLGADYATV